MKKLFFLFILFCFNANAQIVNIPDANFKAKLIQLGVDTNSDGQIQQSEALAMTTNLNVFNSNISSLEGIQSFVNLTGLNCSYNNLTTLDVSNLTHLSNLTCSNNHITLLNVLNLTQLTILDVSFNQITNLSVSNLIHLNTLEAHNNAIDLGTLTSIDASGCSALMMVDLSWNQLTSINVSGCILLYDLRVSHNQLTTLNLSGCFNLHFLYADNNQLTALDVTNCSSLMNMYLDYNQLTILNFSGSPLQEIHASHNEITSLNVSGCHSLSWLDANHNHLTTLDVSECIGLHMLDVYYNNLTTLFLKNGADNGNITFSNNPNLIYICADDVEVSQIQNALNAYGYTNCSVNSYCSFTPGGTFYTIKGNNKFDGNNNGCDVSDSALPNLKFNISNGTNSGSLISNALGNYSIPVQAGTHTVTPVFENPNYFTASPASIVVTFPTQASPFVQNFCITSNGIHPDLEVVMMPLGPARPGFDATYKLIYKNKGNIVQSGNVAINFDDVISDFVSATPVVTSQTLNNLSWDFTNLVPFETREIIVTLNVNSPTETPAVNGGDILNYTAIITSAGIDETPNDNTSVFNQTVANSLDPNDKTCLEGATIALEKVGEYVHYIIHFENNGTANAQNIVVKDMIDTNKFDVSSIIPINGSHTFVTKIASENKVEFIFENINMPFDDANNDGYVAFKIKTKPTLTNGDTFSNTASIYFDYNFPIITNTATTTIAALAVQNFEFSNYFNIYPNPVHNVLNISTKEAIEVTSVNIYNTLGQLVLLVPNAQNTKMVDVSNLTSGNYFIKINSDKGTSNAKFVKH